MSPTFSTTYDLQGNILSHALAGTYQYEGSKPHAVTSVTPSSGFPDAISSAQCETEYNCLGQPSRIAEGNVEILLEYGADGQRTKAVYKNNGNIVRTHYYISAYYEKEIDSRGVVTHYHYIYGANGLAAVCMRRGGTDKLFYVHPDRLGSYTHITDENKQVLRALHFDPWGNVKTDTDWTVFAGNAPSSLYLSYCFDRGFTSHEHYADLKVINMNGRLYDPVIARFFSPDNFVQVPDFTQSYNRYSYCLNNPLQYVDPSGENFVSIFLYNACTFFTFPARLTTEAVSWVNDHINGEVKADGYFHPDYLFDAAPPHSIDYQNVINLQNPFTATFYEPDMMTDADGTTYRTEYYWAAVGAGGKYTAKIGNGFWKKLFSSYRETIRWYTREVEIPASSEHHTNGSVFAAASAIFNISGNTFYNPNTNRWLGKNGKFYDFTFNGNGSTGGRNKFAKATSSGLKWGGRILGGISTINDVYDFFTVNTTEGRAKATMELIADGVGSVPDIGPFFTLYWNLGGRELHWMWYNNVLMSQIEMGINPGLMIYQPFK